MSRAVIVSMGCSKNLVDSERLAAMMAGRGIDVVFDGEPQAGDDDSSAMPRKRASTCY